VAYDEPVADGEEWLAGNVGGVFGFDEQGREVRRPDPPGVDQFSS
jgi:hypothetical protein